MPTGLFDLRINSFLSDASMLVDTHCHLYHEKFDADRDAVIDRAREAGVVQIVMPAIDVASIYAALKLAHRHDGLFVMAALHPSETKEATEADMDTVATLARDPRVVAIGESGLDYYWDRSFDEKQEAFFRRHIRLAAEMGKPLILHNRAADADMLRVLGEEHARISDPDRLRTLLHCFSGPAEVAAAALALGCVLGIGGTLTYKNSAVAESIASVPMDKLVLETDAPFLAPVPMRGKRNEPAFVVHVARRLAEARNLTVGEVAQATTKTARRFFGLPEV